MQVYMYSSNALVVLKTSQSALEYTWIILEYTYLVLSTCWKIKIIYSILTWVAIIKS